MSPELQQLLADAPQMDKFPKTRLIELGLKEGWPAELIQYFGHVTVTVSISGIVETACMEGIVPVEGNDELLSIPELPCNEFPHGGWRSVFEAADQWRKNHDRVKHTVMHDRS